MRGVVIEDAAARDDRRRRADIENARENHDEKTVGGDDVSESRVATLGRAPRTTPHARARAYPFSSR